MRGPSTFIELNHEFDLLRPCKLVGGVDRRIFTGLLDLGNLLLGNPRTLRKLTLGEANALTCPAELDGHRERRVGVDQPDASARPAPLRARRRFTMDEMSLAFGNI